MPEPKKLLIVLLGAIGDVTRGTSLAVRIKAAWPECVISWAVEPKSREIVEAVPEVDKVFVFDRPAGLPAYRTFIKALRAERFDLVLDLQRHLKSGFTSWYTKAPRRIGFHRTNAKEGNWLFNTETIPAVENFSAKIDHYHLFGDVLGLPRPASYQFNFSIPDSADKRAEELLASAGPGFNRDRIVVLIPGSSWPSRFWIAERYREVITSLHADQGASFIVVGGPAEKAFSAEIASEFSSDVLLDLTGKTNIPELIALFRHSHLAIGSDSGPMHIAAASGLRVVSLWGSTSPKRSAPFKSEDLAVVAPTACAPCYRKECPGLGRLCMFEIPSRAVIAKAQSCFGIERQ